MINLLKNIFIVVAIIDEAVSLYAHDFEKNHVCVLIKKSFTKKESVIESRSSSSNSENGETVNELFTITVSVKCPVNTLLATALTNEICDQIVQLEEHSSN